MDVLFLSQINSTIPTHWIWLSLVSLLILLHVAISHFQKPSPVRVTPAGPSGIFTLWTIMQRLKTHQFYEWMKDTLAHPGHTAQMSILGTKFILTENAENIQAVFTTQFKSYGKGVASQRALGYLLPPNALTIADGEVWRQKRKIFRPLLSSVEKSDIQVTEYHVQKLLDSLSSSSEGVDVYDSIDKLQLDITLHRFLGHKTIADIERYNQFQEGKKVLGLAGVLALFFGSIGSVVGWMISRKAKKEVDGYVDSLVALMANSQQSSLFDNVVDEKGRKAIVESNVTREFLRVLLLSGRDPLVTSTTWTLYQLAIHPDIVQRLRLEITSILGSDRPPSLQDLDKMGFLKNVIRETMRLNPTVGFNIREALTDTTLPRGGGKDGQDAIAIQKGDVVFMSLLGMYRNPDSVGPDADIWRPDRWDTWTPPKGEFIPFSTGPRVCMGQAFGQFQMEYAIVRILQRFASISYHGQEQRIKFHVNTKPALPTLCRFHLPME